VDLFTDGGFGLPCPSAGCLDLDGSTGDAAHLRSIPVFTLQDGVTYQLTANVRGNARGGASDLIVLGMSGGAFFQGSENFTLAPDDDWRVIEVLLQPIVDADARSPPGPGAAADGWHGSPRRGGTAAARRGIPAGMRAGRTRQGLLAQERCERVRDPVLLRRLRCGLRPEPEMASRREWRPDRDPSRGEAQCEPQMRGRSLPGNRPAVDRRGTELWTGP
jgi:hypothetical protein